MRAKKILMLTPDLRLLGGVANHFLGLKPHWTNKVKYLSYGRRITTPALLVFPIDLIKFLWNLVFWQPKLVVVNPSLRYYQLMRDGIYLCLSYIFGVKCITFFHGWDYVVGARIAKKPKLFNAIYGRSEFIYVLSKDFKHQLQEIGVKCPILTTTTKFDNKLIKEFDINNRNGEITNLLFLARVEENKGIFIALEAFKILADKYPNLMLTVVGPGKALQSAKEWVKHRDVSNVNFTGPLMGSNLISELKRGDLYLLPTTHGEGMPTTVLEAMAFGLPIITRPVGGLKDFFMEGRMGYLLQSLEPNDYAKSIEILLQDKILTQEISHYNHIYALHNFIASSVASKIEQDFSKYIR